jgi:predicted ArsR family transcriptional regulator
VLNLESKPFLTTRDKILRHLLIHCSNPCDYKKCTAKGIAEALNLTPNGVRQHIGILEKDNLVILKEKKGKAGRPAIVYSLHENAIESFPKSYAEFGTELLNEVITKYGKDEAINLLKILGKKKAREVIKAIPNGINDIKSIEYLNAKIRIIMKIFNQIGKYAEMIEEEDYYLIKTHNCLLYQIYKGNPLICNIDETLLTEIFDHVPIKDKCIRDGDGYCLYRITKDLVKGSSSRIDNEVRNVYEQSPV